MAHCRPRLSGLERRKVAVGPGDGKFGVVIRDIGIGSRLGGGEHSARKSVVLLLVLAL